MVTVGQQVSLTFEKPAAGGRMIARHEGQVILVAGVIPGERVRAQVEHVGKGVAYAHAIEVETASPDRRAVSGDPLCGGCLYRYIAYERQLAIKSQVIADAFHRIGRLPLRDAVPVAASPEEGYRMRARLHVRGRRLGFFREGTHEVCDARQTRQLLDESCDALDRLGAALEAARTESVREVELSENVDASDRVVFLDASSALDPHVIDPAEALRGFSGVITAFGAHGESRVTDRITIDGAAVSLKRHVLAFFQGNRHLLGALVAHVIHQLPAEGSVVDLYAGVGLFAVSAAASRGVEVTAVEGDRTAAADLVANAGSAGGRVIAVHQAVEEFLRRPPGASAVIVDPPRTGLSRDAVNGIVRLRAPRVIYVSCDVATLARDARHLVDAGYTIDRIDAFDLFPNTPHVETVVVFVTGEGARGLGD
jgi:23S rRNA (uracil1939-C5)-methyltransferase